MNRRCALNILTVLLLVSTAGCSTLPAPSPAGTPSLQWTTEWTVTITRVIDGDTVEARFANGEIDTLRLLGVDTPETTLSRNDPTAFNGIPDTPAGRDHLLEWGERATVFATAELANQTVRIAVDPLADRRDTYGRLLVYICLDEDQFNKRIISEGYARVYPTEFSFRGEFDDAETTARNQDVGLWNYTGSTPVSDYRVPLEFTTDS